MSTLKTGNITHPSSTGTAITLDASDNVNFNSNAVTGIASVNGGQIGGNRNLIINGAMQVAQRGTSKTGLGNGDNGYHTLDRYRFSESGSPTGEFTMSQSTDAPDGFGYSMKFECTTADTSMAAADRFQVSTRIEAQNLQHLKYGTSDAQTLSLSFWVKSSKTGTYCIGLVQPDNSSLSFVREYTINSANTWEYKTLTIDGDTTGSIANDTGNGLELGFALAAGSNYHETPDTWTGSYEYATSNQVNLADSTSNTWQLTGVQLEIGSQATPFEHRSYGDELARCQRYFEIFENTSSGFRVNGVAYSTTDTNFALPFLVEKRATPTVTITNVGQIYRSGAWRTATGSSVHGAITRGCTISIEESGNLTAGSAYFIRNYELTVDAEL